MEEYGKIDGFKSCMVVNRFGWWTGDRDGVA